MNNVFKFVSVSLLPVLYNVRASLEQDLLGWAIVFVDGSVLVLLVCAAGYMWTFPVVMVRGIALQMIGVILVVWASCMMSYVAYLMWTFVVQRHPAWSWLTSFVLSNTLPPGLLALYGNWTR